MLDTTGLHCVVVGAGEVGCRKLGDVLHTRAASVLVVDPCPCEALQALCADPRVTVQQRGFIPDDLDGAALVFAAAGSADVNRLVTAACAARGILCNCADAPERGGFIVPARVQAGQVTLAVSTQGGSPALARRLREDLQQFARPYAALSELLTRVRPLVLALGEPSPQNAELFRALARSALGDLLVQGDGNGAEALLRTLLPQPLHSAITELLHDLV